MLAVYSDGVLLMSRVESYFISSTLILQSIIVTHPSTTATSQWNVFRLKEVIGSSDRYTPVQGPGSIQVIYYTSFGLYFTCNHTYKTRGADPGCDG